MNTLSGIMLLWLTLHPIDMEVTGYSNDAISINVPKYRDGLTATRAEARVGLCAADWDKHPVGTLIYVPNYGICEVQDRGGAIKGKALDLFFNSRSEALTWGRRTMKVYVIEGVPSWKRKWEGAAY